MTHHSTRHFFAPSGARPRSFITCESGSYRWSRWLLVVIAMCVAQSPLALLAQESTRPSPARAGIQPANRPRPVGQAKPRRPVVDKLQQRVDNVLRNRLQLTDDQFNKLRSMNARLDEERLAIRQEENTARRELRQELLPGAATNDAHVSQLLDKLPQIERKRIALQEREQKELAGFLQPLQRARYFALQDEIRRSLQDVQRRRLAPGDSGALPPRGRGGRLDRR